MKFLKRAALALAAFALLALGTSDLAFAAASQNGVDYNGSPITSPLKYSVPSYVGFANVTANSTFNANTFSDLPGSTVTFTPAPYDPTVNVDLLFVTWHLNGTKATGTTGTCELFANGARIAATAQTVANAAGATDMSGSWIVALSASGSQTVKLQCESADTSVLTVANGQLDVFEIRGVTPFNP